MCEITDYGQVPNSHILNIFGDEMTYNDLRQISWKPDKYTHLKVERSSNSTTHLLAIYFDGKKVFENIYKKHHSCNMFYHLEELHTILQEECEICDGCEKMKKIYQQMWGDGKDGKNSGARLCIDCWT